MYKGKNIILIRPPFRGFIYKQINPPLGLGYLASYLEERGYEVIILDLALRRVENSTLLEYIKKKKPILIGITALSSYYSGMKSVSNFLRNAIPELIIVLGGVHVSSLPEISLKECNADYIVVGEGEITLLELIHFLEGDDKKITEIQGLAFNNGDSFQINPKRKRIQNLDSLSFPAWNKINPNKYPKDVHQFMLKHKKIAPIITSRGCPYNCDYCASCNFWKQNIQFRSPKNVVDEIQYLHETYGIREIHFWDDNLTLQRKHIWGICQEIIKRNLHKKMAFTTPNGIKIDTLDEKILKIMKITGFYKLDYPVESGSQKLLKSVKKNLNLKKVVQNAVIAKNLGFILNSAFILGFPEETEETVEKSILFAKSVPFDFTTFFLMKPLPGSKVFEDWSVGKDISKINWNDLNFFGSTFLVSKLSVKYLEKAQRRAHMGKMLTLNDFINHIKIRALYFQISQLKYFIARIIHLIYYLFGMHYRHSLFDV